MLIVLINALVAGVLAGSGAFLAVAYALPKGQSLDEITCGIILATGVANACKDWQSHMSVPPPKAIIAGLAALCLLLVG